MALRDHFSTSVALQPPFGKSRRDALNLSSNELQHPAFSTLFRKFLSEYSLESGFARYPALNLGTAALAAAHQVPEASLVLTPGADLGIRAIIEAMGASGCLVAPVPCYRAYPEYAAVFGLRFVGIDALRATESLFIEQMTSAIVSNAPCLVGIANPDGITGRVWSHSAIAKILAVCESTNSILVFDDAYAAFSTQLPAMNLGSPHSMRVSTFSKSHGAAGIRLAFIQATPEMAQQIARTRVSNGISGMALSYLGFILREQLEFARLADDLMAWRQDAEAAVRSMHPSWHVPASQANFIFFDTHCTSTIEQLLGRLDCCGIRIRLFTEIKFSTCARVTVAAPPLMKRVIECLGALA